MLPLKAEPARQLVDNAYLSWTWSVLRTVFLLTARLSWLNLKRHEWKRLRGFTVRVSFNQTNKQTNKHPIYVVREHVPCALFLSLLSPYSVSHTLFVGL